MTAFPKTSDEVTPRLTNDSTVDPGHEYNHPVSDNNNNNPIPQVPGTRTCEYNCGCNGSIAQSLTIHEPMTIVAPCFDKYYEDHKERKWQRPHGADCPNGSATCQSFACDLTHDLQTAQRMVGTNRGRKPPVWIDLEEGQEAAALLQWRPVGPCLADCFCYKCRSYQYLYNARNAITDTKYLCEPGLDSDSDSDSNSDSDSDSGCRIPVPKGYEDDISESELVDIVEQSSESSQDTERYIEDAAIARFDPGLRLLYMTREEIQYAIAVADHALSFGLFDQPTPELQAEVNARCLRMFSNMEAALAQLPVEAENTADKEPAQKDRAGNTNAKKDHANDKRPRAEKTSAAKLTMMKVRFDVHVRNIFGGVDPKDMTSRDQILAAHTEFCAAVRSGRFFSKDKSAERQALLNEWVADVFASMNAALDAYYDSLCYLTPDSHDGKRKRGIEPPDPANKRK